MAVTWKWEISTDQTNWITITDATTNSYTPGTDDIGDHLRVTATYDDEKGPGKTVEAETDAVLTAPATNTDASFADLNTTRSVPENTVAGQPIGARVAAVDPDNEDTLTYSLGGADASSFDIDTSNGQLKTKDALDFDSGQRTYSVDVSVSDSKDDYDTADRTVVDDTIDVTIDVTNMEVPAIPELPTVTPTPGAAAGLTVSWTAVTATETMPVDGYDVQYRKKDATPPADWSSASVTVTGATATITGLEYSTTYEVEVRSKNSEGESDWSPTGEGNIPSRLNVSFSPAGRTINEGSNGTFTVTVSPAADRALLIPVSASSSNAESDDYSVSGTPLTFASGGTSKTFTVSTTNDSDRDDETVNLAFGQLPAAVGVGSQATASLTINDTTPAPRGGGGGGTIPSSLSVSFGQAIYTVTEGNTSIIIVNVSPAADRALSILVTEDSSNAESGDYSVSGTPLTFASGDTSKTFTVSTISDSDMDDETVNLAFGQLPAAVVAGTHPTSQLTIEDTTTAQSTNAVPEFASDATTTLFVPENTPAGENIGDPFTATDDDDTTLTYSLDDQDGASFEVDASGQIKTKSALDYETKDTYAVTVSVHDGKGPLGNANTAVDATIDVTINVGNLDIPDAPAEPTVTPTPGAAAGLTVSWTAVTATETMPVDGYDVQYRKKDATPPADWSSASVTVTGATATITGLEYSTTYEVEVRSKNSEGESDWSPTGEGNIPSRLNVSFSPAGRTINEGSNGTFTVTVSPAADRALLIPVSASSSNAESDDYSVSGTPLTFASGGTSKTFTVSTTNDSDRDDETVNLRFGQLPVAVGVGSQATASLTINDTTPAPRGGGGGGTIPSSLSVSFGQAIYTVTEGNTSIIIVNVSPAADRALSILVTEDSSNAESGDYSVSGTPLTFASGDTSKTFTVSTISDSDMDDETVNLAFGQLPAAVVAGTHPTSQLTIEDTTTAQSTNAVPEFASDATTTLFVPENTPAGENIGDPFTATDDDDTTLTYSLDDQDGASFEVDASGQIKTKSALDYETKDTYAVTVSVHDGKGPLGNANTAVDATIDVTINVGNLDIPDAPAEPTVTPTPGAAAGLTVSWTAVTATETMPVDGYDVQYRKKDATPPADWSSASVTVTGATATITGLEYSTTYEVEVRSKNSEGESDWSPTGEGNIPSRLNVSFSPAGRTINEGSNGTFTVTVSPAADRALLIPVSASSSNAESDDYSVSGTPLTFASGDTSKTFTVSTTNDSDRDDETVSLRFGQLPAAVGTRHRSQQHRSDNQRHDSRAPLQHRWRRRRQNHPKLAFRVLRAGDLHRDRGQHLHHHRECLSGSGPRPVDPRYRGQQQR